MATTESRTGFRLPWVGDHRSDESSETEQATDVAADASAAPDGMVDEATTAEAAGDTGTTADTETTAGAEEGSETTPMAEMTDTAAWPAVSDGATANRPAGDAVWPTGSAGDAGSQASAAAAARKPTKFLADLTKAMQAAAEAERQETLELFQLEAKSFIESIHGRASTEAEELRKRADEDVSAIRDWSKQEIARIREETEQKIAGRKNDLSEEIDDHAARIEREIERVQATVTRFEDAMASFFETLLAETDPTRFAALAANLPEPPSFDAIVAAADANHRDRTAAAAPDAVTASPEAAAEAVGDPWGIATAQGSEPAAPAVSASDVVVDTALAPDDDQAVGATTGTDATPTESEMSDADREAAFAAIEASARAAEAVEPAPEDGATDETTASDGATASVEAESGATGEAETQTETESDPTDGDPRIAALGLSDFDTAEAEALADLPSSDEEVPEIAEDALAARLAGLVADQSAETHDQDAAAAAPEDTAAQTSVVVVGLVSVASIASFKRHLARVPGVQSVGVSSGPDGEFVFAVRHDPSIELREVVPTLPGFGARVTDFGDGFVRATAHDADAAS